MRIVCSLLNAIMFAVNQEGSDPPNIE